jgi:hypothetical protein
MSKQTKEQKRAAKKRRAENHAKRVAAVHERSMQQPAKKCHANNNHTELYAESMMSLFSNPLVRQSLMFIRSSHQRSKKEMRRMIVPLDGV